MYPCCVIIALIFLKLWGAEDKAKIFINYIKKSIKYRGKEKVSLKEEFKKNSAFKDKYDKGRYTDGRTQIINL